MSDLRFEGEDISADKLPVPCGWRLLIGMLIIEQKSKGGILLTEEHVRDQGYLRQLGKVLAVGSQAYAKPDFQNGIPVTDRTPEPWAKVGDIVMIKSYTGQEVSIMKERVPPEPENH